MELKHEEFFSYQYYVKYVCIVFSYPGYTETRKTQLVKTPTDYIKVSISLVLFFF